MKTLLSAGLLAMSLSGAAWADHHPPMGGHDGHGAEKPCVMQLGADGKPTGQPCCDMPCCQDCCKDMGKDHHAGHGGMVMAMEGDKGPASVAYHDANMVMHKGMTFPFSGDADIDFLKGMIAHHQGAVDMAQVQLKHGKDAQVRRMSREIIRAQNLEIGWMKSWLKQLEAKKDGYRDSGWLGSTKLYQ